MNPFDDILNARDDGFVWKEQNLPQRIFVEVGEEVVQVRKQDNKLYIGKSREELKAAEDAFRWARISGLQPAEMDQAIDDLEKARKMEEGK